MMSQRGEAIGRQHTTGLSSIAFLLAHCRIASAWCEYRSFYFSCHFLLKSDARIFAPWDKDRSDKGRHLHSALCRLPLLNESSPQCQPSTATLAPHCPGSSRPRRTGLGDGNVACDGPTPTIAVQLCLYYSSAPLKITTIRAARRWLEELFRLSCVTSCGGKGQARNACIGVDSFQRGGLKRFPNR